VRVDPAVLFVDNGQVLTSAGLAAGIDLCLHLISRDHGAAVAARTARALVVPLRREGGMAQLLRHPGTGGDPLHATVEWLYRNLHRRLTLADRPPGRAERPSPAPRLPGADGHHAAAVAAVGQGGAGPGTAGDHRSAGGGDRPSDRLRLGGLPTGALPPPRGRTPLGVPSYVSRSARRSRAVAAGEPALPGAGRGPAATGSVGPRRSTDREPEAHGLRLRRVQPARLRRHGLASLRLSRRGPRRSRGIGRTGKAGGST
jgi:hypothetical protein